MRYSKELSIGRRRLWSDEVLILCGRRQCHRLERLERRRRIDGCLDEGFGSENDDWIGIDETQDLSGWYNRHDGYYAVSNIRGLSVEGDLLVDLFDSFKTMARGRARVG